MRKSIVFAVLLGLAAFSEASYGLSVVPGAVGYGMSTPAGRGGKVMLVTNLNSSGPGSLRECVEASGSRVCVFEVSGTITLTDMLVASNPYLTIAGQTAPSPGITLRGNLLKIKASDVLVQHLHIRSGDGPEVVDPSTSGAMSIGAGAKSSLVRNVVIDHVSMSWGMDETIEIIGSVSDVTIRNSIMSEGLYDSLNAAPESYAALTEETADNVSFFGNLFAHNKGRSPRSLSKHFILANNVVYNFGQRGTDLSLGANGAALYHSIVGNLFIRGPDSGNYLPISIRTKASSSGTGGSQVYVDGNRSVDHSVSSQWALVDNELSASPAVSSPPAWLPGLNYVSAIDGNVLDLVLDKVGARVVERDSVDRRIVNDVRQKTGRIVNCVDSDGSTRCARNAGGWPSIAQNQTKHTLPANPNADDDGDGYTNLEEWLHEMAARVEGKSADTPVPNPPAALSII